LENGLGEMVGMCTACVGEVFGIEDKVKAEGEQLEQEEYKPVGGDAVLQESLDAARKRKAPPVIVPFKKLSLLGI